MPVYRYEAVDPGGRTRTGTMPAHDEGNLEEKLHNLGFWLVDAGQERVLAATEDSGARPGGMRLWGRHNRRELIDFCTLMAFQTKVGVTLVQALEVAAMECEDIRFREVLAGLRRHIEGGDLFWEALEKYPSVFSHQFVCVIRAGEQSSKLPETFNDLKAYLEWTEQILNDVRQASLYPAIVLTVVSGFVLFLFTAIIPKFVTLLTSVNAALPTITVIVFAVSDFAKATWWAWVLAILFFTVGLAVGRRISPRFAYFADSLMLRMPVFGELNRMLAVSRFAHNLAILYRSGIPILQSLHLCRGLVGNAVVERAVAAVEEGVKSGGIISEAMRRQRVFPAMLLRMVIMGETTGNLDHALENVSTYYNDVIPRRLKKIFTIMEPTMVVFLVFMVGAVALSIFLPIISLMTSIR